MSDSAHNTFVTVIIILAIILVAALFFRGFRSGNYASYIYQPASATIVERVVPVYSQSVVSYSRGSSPVKTYNSTSSSTNTYTSYDTTYSYTQPAPQVTYYGTGYTVPSYNYYHH